MPVQYSPNFVWHTEFQYELTPRLTPILVNICRHRDTKSTKGVFRFIAQIRDFFQAHCYNAAKANISCYTHSAALLILLMTAYHRASSTSSTSRLSEIPVRDRASIKPVLPFRSNAPGIAVKHSFRRIDFWRKLLSRRLFEGYQAVPNLISASGSGGGGGGDGGYSERERASSLASWICSLRQECGWLPHGE